MRPAQVEITEGQQMCAICSDVGNGVHFGVITCEGCKVRLFELLLLEDELIATSKSVNTCHYFKSHRLETAATLVSLKLDIAV